MSDLLDLYVALERDEETRGIPTDRRILSAIREMAREGVPHPYTPAQIAVRADCEPEDVEALAESMGFRWPLNADGGRRYRQASFGFDRDEPRRRRDRAQSVVELRRFRDAYVKHRGWRMEVAK